MPVLDHSPGRVVAAAAAPNLLVVVFIKERYGNPFRHTMYAVDYIVCCCGFHLFLPWARKRAPTSRAQPV